MSTLLQATLDFNRKIKLSNDGGALSSDAGILLYREFDEKLGFFETIHEELNICDDRKFWIHSNLNMFRQKLYQLSAGYAHDDAADSLKNDPIFTEAINTDSLASQPSLSRLIHRFTTTNVDELNQANQRLLDKVHQYRDSQELIFDLDSTHADTFGNQEESLFNAHYGTIGFHPLVAFDGVTGDFLKAQLRPGNVYTSNGVVDFLKPMIEHYNLKFPETIPLVRGDSGFAVPALYELCEKESAFYVIRLKANANLQKMADELHPTDFSKDKAKSEVYYEETSYQAKSWSKPRRVIIKSVRPAGELFFVHSFIVTNFSPVIKPDDICQIYQNRGTMENYIKEAKNGFAFDKMSSHSFFSNQVKMMMALLAYNLTNWLRKLCFPSGKQTMQIETIRTRIIKVAGKIIRSGRSLHVKLAKSFVYETFFWNVLKRIQRLQIE